MYIFTIYLELYLLIETFDGSFYFLLIHFNLLAYILL